MLLRERTEPSVVSSGLLSQRVDIPRQASAHGLSCSENLVGKRRGAGGLWKGIANQWVIRFRKFSFSTASTEKLLHESK